MKRSVLLQCYLLGLVLGPVRFAAQKRTLRQSIGFWVDRFLGWLIDWLVESLLKLQFNYAFDNRNAGIPVSLAR
jgi:hypothetical protein